MAKPRISSPAERRRDMPWAMTRGGLAASRIGSTTNRVTARMAADTKKKVGWNPVYAAMKSTPLPPTAWPIEAPANIRPLARPRSSSARVLQASASMATSCIAPKVLCTSRMPVNSASCAGKSSSTVDISVVAIMTCVAMIQPRRRPRRSDAKTSMKGPKAHLKAQGR